MFTKKPHADVKKSTLKLQDLKKDSATRLKHLKIVLDNVELEEARAFFETNFSHIYSILYDSFITAETNLRQRVHKAHREELECVLVVLERVLTLLPDLLGKRWQCHSLTRLMAKLLHPGNSWKLRKEAMRYFLLWYQALGDIAPNAIHAMFATLVPSFPSPFPGLGLDSLTKTGGNFQDSLGQVGPVELFPIFPPQSGEKQPDDPPRFFLEALLDLMVSQVGRIEWRDRSKQHKCFTFLFDRFKQYYLPHLFPDFSTATSVYKPNLELPTLRRQAETIDGRRRTDPLTTCKVAFIKWIAYYTHNVKKGDGSLAQSARWVTPPGPAPGPAAHPPVAPPQINAPPNSGTPSDDNDRVPGTELRRVSVSQAGVPNHDVSSPDSNHSISFSQELSVSEDPNTSAGMLVREVLYSCRENVNLVHEVYRQAFLLDMTQAAAIRISITVYKDWIHMKVPELPPFMLEPLDGSKDDHRSIGTSSESSSLESNEPIVTRQTRLRNDSYLGAIHRENLLVRAGLQNVYQVFITHAAYIFTLEVSPEFPPLLEEQVDTCKRVLNIYRYMVMNTRMEAKTWEQLLIVLLQVTSLILTRTPPKRKDETLGGKLAPALFQTLIVTWIKANLNVAISGGLWDQFLAVLSSLTQWEELIREWAKTLETLTRVLARHVYNLDLNDLPLDRLSEQKAKRRRGNTASGPANGPVSTAFGGGDPTRASGGPSSMEAAQLGGSSRGRRIRDRAMTTPSEKSTPVSVHHDDMDTAGPSSFVNSEAGSSLFRLSSLPATNRKRVDSSSETTILRSASETNLILGRTAHNHHHHHHHRHSNAHGRTRSSRPHSNTVIIPVLPPSVEVEVARILALPEGRRHRPVPRLKRRSRSMDSLRCTRGGSPMLQLCESDCPTRSPSPAPSSGLESNSFKDSPMQIDVIGGDNTSIDTADNASTATNTERRSVMAGGSERGWLPDVAVVLWRRMLGALGDVNRLADPALHAQVFRHLVELAETMNKIRLNQGVSSDNQGTPPPPDLVPPLTIIAPWCFQALRLPDSYQKGKLSACRLLCKMTITAHDIPLSRDHITQFYSVLHHGLIGTDQSMMNSLVEYCGPRFFSLQLPGYSLLLLDFIHAANTIVSSTDIQGTPRTEAMSILGALLCLTNSLSSLPVLQPNAVDYSIMSCVDAKDHIVSILLKCGKREPAGLARCIALSSLGIYLYQELSNPLIQSDCSYAFHPKVREAVNVLLLALQFNHRIIGQVASDIILLLVDHMDVLQEHFPDVPARVVEVIAMTLAMLTPQEKTRVSERDRRLLTSLLFGLGEWVMALPRATLLSVSNLAPSGKPRQNEDCLLHKVFKVLIQLSGGSGGSMSPSASDMFPSDLLQEFEPNIAADNLREGAGGPRRGSSVPPETYAFRPPCLSTVRLAAKMVLIHLINHVGHFPMVPGAGRLSSLVVEHDDVPGLPRDEHSVQIFSAPNIQLMMMNEQRLLSLIELPALEVPGGGVTAGLTTARSQVRVLLRDLGGKACWDAAVLYCRPEDSTNPGASLPYSSGSNFYPIEVEESMLTSCAVTNAVPQHALRHRPPHQLPTFSNSAPDLDNLDDLLQYIGHTSPECLESLDMPRNVPSKPPPLTSELEEEVMTRLVSQRYSEKEYIARMHNQPFMLGERAKRPDHTPPVSPFQHCRLLFSQLGLAGWERRAHLHLLSKNEKLLRELRNLDSQRCRETHKIAVIYVAEGQEDKNSILSNTCGSQAYEEFIAGLAWEVELETHTGFLGGLQRNKSAGDTAPYYATSFLETIFHVATRMPSSSNESLLQKTRHLGNDEVHIVWSEHSRDYRRGIIPTDFCDVLIVIYPLPNKLCRIQVSRKPEVPYFGPLFNEAIVSQSILPGLVRATAISASRAMRSLLSFYQQYYEDRAKSLETVVRNHKDANTFEEFTAQIVSPTNVSLLCSGPSRTSGNNHNCIERESCPQQGSQLTAALLDSHRHSPQRPPTAGLQDVQLRGQESDTLHGISPRPVKKLALRSGRNSRVAGSSLTPPDSPTGRKANWVPPATLDLLCKVDGNPVRALPMVVNGTRP